MAADLSEVSFGDLDAAWWGDIWYLVFAYWGLIEFFALPALLWFGLFFPEGWRLDVQFPWVQMDHSCRAVRSPYLLSRISLSGWLPRNRAPVFHRVKSWVDRITGWGQVACIMIFLIAIFDKLRSASTPDARRRLRVLAVGSGLSLGPLLIMFGVLPRFGYSFTMDCYSRSRSPFWLFSL